MYSTNEYYYINFDDTRFLNFTAQDFPKLQSILLELYGEKKIFVFDEIQNIKGWEIFVRRLINSQYKIYITGSNANLLSRELGTHLTGIHIQLLYSHFLLMSF